MNKIIIILFAIFFNKICYSQINIDSISNSILNEGLYLFNLEKHAWVSSDIVLSDKKNAELFNGYITYNDGDTTVTVFYYYTIPRIEVVFTIKSPKDSISSNNYIVDAFPHKPDKNEEKLIKAREEIKKIIIEAPKLSSFIKVIYYNIAFHQRDSIIKCYLMAGVNTDTIVPLGGDCRIDLSNDYKIIDIEYYNLRLHGDKRPLMKGVYETWSPHFKTDSRFISPTEICVYKLYDSKYNNTKIHIIKGVDYVSIFDSENNTLRIVNYNEYYHMIKNNYQ